ncbi:hypothetical protein HK096_001393 [Nowakowskiella sp. JEL0078]|nr:hypothetical protein HK096_001393 [Nowakowskiella sp. JEL0078]
MPTLNPKYSLERFGSFNNTKPNFYDGPRFSSPKPGLYAYTHPKSDSSLYSQPSMQRKSTSKVSPEVDYEEFPELPSQDKSSKVIKALKSALKRTKSTTERMISFNSILSYNETWSRDEYDRSSVPMATLTFTDVLELRIMRQDATRQAIAESGFRHLSNESCSPPLTSVKPVERRNSQPSTNQSILQNTRTANSPRRFSNLEPQYLLPHSNYFSQYGYFVPPSDFFTPDFVMFPPQRISANIFAPAYDFPTYVRGLSV